MRNIRYTFILTLTTLLMLAMPVCADDNTNENNNNATSPQDLTVIDNGTVKEVLRSDMIMLSDNKRYRLENILIPPFEDPPAIDELNHEFLNKNVTVYTYHENDDNQDRYGVLLAHIVTDKGVWLQEDLVAKGLAWAYSSEKSPQMADILKPVEEKARNQNLGFWKDPAYAIKTPENIKDYMNSYQIVEGRIQSVYVRANSGTVFFNFGTNWKRYGRDWKTDFTARLENEVQLFPLLKDPVTGQGDIPPDQWKGRVVRVRGWVTDDHGPIIVVTHKEQIDILPQSGQPDPSGAQ